MAGCAPQDHTHVGCTCVWHHGWE